jgi:hypothetical protein
MVGMTTYLVENGKNAAGSSLLLSRKFSHQGTGDMPAHNDTGSLSEVGAVISALTA